jgi:hypothetical protein
VFLTAVFMMLFSSSLTLSTLLASAIIMMSMQVVESSPLVKRNSKFVTMPLKRVDAERTRDLHPQIRLQQNINRGIRRLARMTGRDAPSSSSLEQNLVKRVQAVEGTEGLERRFNHMGLERTVVLEKRYNRIGYTPPKANSASLISLKGKKAAPAAPAVSKANTPSVDNSLGLDIEAQDVGYLANVQIGTPPRDFSILMDSGSADFWVGAENCQSDNGGGCGNHNFLGTQSSSSFQDTGAPFSVTYGTGQVSGNVITDNIAIAGLTLDAHTFGVATTESVDFSADSTPFDGLMGLAQSTLAQQQTPTPVDSLATAGLIQDAIVSFKISRLADNLNDGEITFGGLDDTKFDPKTLITVPNVNQQGFWEAGLDAATVDGKDTGLIGRTAILDTGTTLLVLPAADAQTLHNQIQGAKSDGQGGFTIPCTTKASIALTFGGQQFAIDPRDIAFQPVNPNNPQGDCVSGITSGSVGGANEWLVGDVFLKNAYFSTDTAKNTVSLAKLV